jgi:hypothetical protein
VRGVRPIERQVEGQSAPRPRSSAATVVPCAVRSRPMAVPRWMPQDSSAIRASPPLPTAGSGSKKGGLTQAAETPQGHRTQGAGRNRPALARRPTGLPVGASGGASAGQ